MKRLLAPFVFAWLALAAACAAAAPIKVVYDLADGIPQATRALNNIRNHLAAEPGVKIVVVAHGAGVDFLLDGAKDAEGQPFAGRIGNLANRGVEFHVCNNTLEARHIPKEKVALEATIVPSGVADVARLEATEGYVYLHP